MRQNKLNYKTNLKKSTGIPSHGIENLPARQTFCDNVHHQKASHHAMRVVKRQTTITAPLISKQLLLFALVLHHAMPVVRK